MIPFNKAYLTGKEGTYIQDCLRSGSFSGNGPFTTRCRNFLKTEFGMSHNFITTSCTDALEMSALLCEIMPGDEVIVPSYTFVSTANAFALRGAILRFADSMPEHPNMDPKSVKKLISEKTKAIVVVHYAGMACDMHTLLQIALEKNIYLIEDAAQALGAKYNDQYLGTFGNLAAFSFHETKNIQCGEGGALIVSDKKLLEKAEHAIEKGTDRMAFLNGKVPSYQWKSLGSSYAPAETTAAFLLAQLEAYSTITSARLALWNRYKNNLSAKKFRDFHLPDIAPYMHHNAHHFFILCSSLAKRNALIDHLAAQQIKSSFHYLPLHKSSFATEHYPAQIALPNAEYFGDCLLRLPLFNGMSNEQVDEVCNALEAHQ